MFHLDLVHLCISYIGVPHLYTQIRRKPRKSKAPVERAASLFQDPTPAIKDSSPPPPIPPHSNLESESQSHSPPNQTTCSRKHHHQLQGRPSQLDIQDEYVSMQSMSDASGHSPQCELTYIEMKSASTVSERSVNFDFPPKLPAEDPYVLMRSMSEASDEPPTKRKISLPARVARESQYIAMSPTFLSPTRHNFHSQPSPVSFPLATERCQVEEGCDYITMKSAK